MRVGLHAIASQLWNLQVVANLVLLLSWRWFLVQHLGGRDWSHAYVDHGVLWLQEGLLEGIAWLLLRVG